MNMKLVNYVAQELAKDDCKNTHLDWTTYWTSFIHAAEVALKARKEYKAMVKGQATDEHRTQDV